GEAGWLLLQLFYIEGRQDESRRLALRLAVIEPDPRDRVRLLLEPARFDAEPVAAAGVIPALEPAVKLDPTDVPSGLAYYRSLARDGRSIESAIASLRDIVDKHPNNAICWDVYLDSLADVGDLESLSKALNDVPKSVAADPRLARHFGRVF